MRKPESERNFRHYIDLLPTTCKEFPLYFSKKDLNNLKGSPLIDVVEYNRA